MNSALLVLPLLVIFCNQLETASQNDNITISMSPVDMMNDTMSLSISSSTNTMEMNKDIAGNTTSVTVIPSLPPAVISTVEMTSADINSMMTSVDALTLTDAITSIVSTPTNAIMMTSSLPLSVSSTLPSITLSIMTSVMTSSVDIIDVSTIMVTTTTTLVMESSSIMVTTTAIIIATSNPVPTSSDSKISGGGLSSGAIVAIVVGVVITLLVILVIVVFCYYQKHCKQKVYVMPKTTCQIMPDGFVRNYDNARTSSHSLLISLRNTFKHKDKEQPEDTKLFITPL